MNTLSRLGLLAFGSLLLLSPLSAAAQFSVGGSVNSAGGWSFSLGLGGGFNCGASTICSIATTILYLINNVLVPLLFAIAFIVFLYGIANAYIFSRGEAEAIKEGHRLMLWGLVGFVVMISLWGLVNVVANTFGLGGYPAPILPRSY